jgi:hypothetical protein
MELTLLLLAIAACITLAALAVVAIIENTIWPQWAAGIIAGSIVLGISGSVLISLIIKLVLYHLGMNA